MSTFGQTERFEPIFFLFIFNHNYVIHYISSTTPKNLLRGHRKSHKASKFYSGKTLPKKYYERLYAFKGVSK